MHVTLSGFVLFLHISVAILAFMMAGVMHAALFAMTRAGQVVEMRLWARLVHRLEPLLPLAALLLLGLGAWLVHLEGDEGVSWSTGWVVTAVVALVVVEAAAGIFLAPRSKALVTAIEQTPDGVASEALRRQAADPVIWHLSHVATVGFLGVVFLMAAKPTGIWSAVIVVAASALGVCLSALQLRAVPSGAGALPQQRTGEGATAPERV